MNGRGWTRAVPAGAAGGGIRRAFVIIAALLAALSLAAVCSVFHTRADAAMADYQTESYKIHAAADADHTIHVKETIHVNFDQSAHHGIYRYIPYTERQYKIKLRSTGDDKHSTDQTSESGVDYLVVKIGDEDKTITGRHTYHINYDLICYEDAYDSYDLLSYNMFPTGWETEVDRVKSTLQLPKSIDWSKLKAYGGTIGSTDSLSDYFSENIDKQTNTITLTGKNVPAGIGATVSARLPQGYWVNPPNRNGVLIPLLLLLIGLPVLTVLLWYWFGRDPKIVQTVEFTPPDGITPCEVGYIIDGSVDNKDVISMLMYYASKGYVAFEDKSKGKGKKNQDLTVIKLKEPEQSEPAYSQYLFQRLFQKQERVNLKKLPKGFGDDLLSVKQKVKDYFSKPENRIFDGKSRVCRGLSYVLIVLITCGALLLGSYYSYHSYRGVASIGSVLLIIVGLILLNWAFDRVNGNSKGKTTLFAILGGAFAAAGVVLTTVWTISWMSSVPLGLLYAAAAVVMIVFSILMRARTPHGAELLGRILGFKNFIKTAEYNRLKMLSDENPEYFFDVMPYAYIFGMEETWAKKFEKIRIPQPSWYYGYDDAALYTALWYTTLMSACASDLDSAMSSAVTENVAGTAGDISGGGSSGGGFGGGGGGAW